MKQNNTSDFAKVLSLMEHLPLKHERSLFDNDSTADAALLSGWSGVPADVFIDSLAPSNTARILRSSRDIYSGATPAAGVKIVPMNEDEARNPGVIEFSFGNTVYGPVFVASTNKGVCYLGLSGNLAAMTCKIARMFPKATVREASNDMHKRALLLLENKPAGGELTLHLKGTEFQLSVWRRLLEIPLGKLTTYGRIAVSLGNEGASRAVGTAVGSNPITGIVPCHRVVRGDGVIGNYYWGPAVKKAILGREFNIK